MATRGCPCDHLGDTAKPCSCTPKLVERYRSRISGPLLDRIDIHIEVPRLPWKELAEEPEGECSAAIRARVEAARMKRRHRLVFLLPLRLPRSSDGTDIRQKIGNLPLAEPGPLAR